jgi:OmpA-OmpF porin, OOP family
MDASTRMQQSGSSLVDGLKALITPGVVSKASSVFGESEFALTKGFDAALPMILGGLANKATDRSFMSNLFDLAKEPAVDGSILGNVASLLGSGTSSSPIMGLGSRLMSMLFGGNTSGLSNALSSFAGLRSSTASSLLNLAAPLVLSFLGKTVRREGLDSTGLTNMLSGQRSSILGLLPNSLSSVRGVGGEAAQATYQTVETAARKASPWRWLLPVLIGLLALWGLFSLFGRREQTVRVATDYISRALPGGVQLRYLRTGIEGKLIAFIEDAGQSVDNATWFDFDRLLFETDSATLRPESREQLGNIAEIMKAYPNVNVRIGGYTDSSGDPAANLRLSQDRANSVRQGLIGLGIAGERLSAEGYGQEHPVADNTTEAGRAQNRRVALRVTQK